MRTKSWFCRCRELTLGILLATAVAAPSWAASLSEIIETGVIRIAVPRDTPHFGSAGDGGALEGYDIEVARLLAQDLGVRAELVPVASVERIPTLLTHRADLIVANLGINPERAKAVAFTSPYAQLFLGVFGPPEVALAGPEDLAGRTIAVTRGTLEDEELSAQAPSGAQILRLDDNAATLRAYLDGEADLIATANILAGEAARQDPDRPIEPKLTIRESPASIGVRRDSPELRDWLNVFVLYHRLNGDLDRLSRKWLGMPLPALPSL